MARACCLHFSWGGDVLTVAQRTSTRLDWVETNKGGNSTWSPGYKPQLHAHHDAVVEYPLIAEVFEEALKALHRHDR